MKKEPGSYFRSFQTYFGGLFITSGLNSENHTMIFHFRLHKMNLFIPQHILIYLEAATRRVLCKKRSYNFHNIHRKTPVPESLF